jgi:hypothetical protein
VSDRINVYGEAGELSGWFDRDEARVFYEDTWFDGHNHVSIATGTRYEHEALLRTEGRRWVLHWWSQWQGSRETYRFITDEQAREWLLKNNEDQAVEEFLGPIEDERGPAYEAFRKGQR